MCSTVLILILSVSVSVLFISVAGQAISGRGNAVAACQGALKLLTAAGEEVEVSDDMEDIEMKVVKAVTEGCGCYRFYEKPNKRGNSFFLETIGTHTIPLRRVSSLSFELCGRGAMAAWSICLIVVGVISNTGMLVGVLYKRMGDKHVPGGRHTLCQHEEIVLTE